MMLSIVIMVLLMHAPGCGDAPPKNRSSPELAAIKVARGAITGYLVAAKSDPIDPYDADVMVPAYERGLKVLQDAEDTGSLAPELLIATIAKLPNVVQLELLWLDAGFRVTGVRIRQSSQPDKFYDFQAMARWTDEDKKPRERTAYRSEAITIDLQQGAVAIDTTVQTRGDRMVMQLPREWVGTTLEACLVYDDGKATAYLPVTSRTVEAEKS